MIVMNKKEYITKTQLYITLIYVVCLLISNLISSRQVLFFNKFELTGAVIIFPITYILSDIMSEVFGYKWSRKTCYMAFACNLVMSLMFMAVINMKAPEYFTNAEAYSTVLWNTWRVLISSLVAYVVWDFVNDKIFQKMKAKHPNDNKWFGRRAIVSSLAGETVDSWIFIPFAFLGTMPNGTLLIMILTQVILKVAYEMIVLPITIVVTRKTQEYENKLAVNKI